MEGEVQVRNLFENNLFIKIISLLAAIFLWMVVYNIDNPYNEKNLVLQLEVINEDSLSSKGLKLMNNNFRRHIDVVVRGRRESVNKVAPSDFQAILDFSKVETVEDTRIEIDGPYEDISDVYISKATPTYVDVELEKVIKKVFPVELKILNQDQVKDNYQIINASVGPEKIELEAVESVINSISHLEAEVNVENLDGNISVLSACTVYNKKGEKIDDFQNITVNVSLNLGKTVPVILTTEGTPANDYLEGIKSISPEKVLITGSNDLMSSIGYIVTEPVNLDGVESDVKTKAKLKLPEGITLVNTENSIDVNIMIDKLLVKGFQVNKNNISLINQNMGESYYYEILNDNIIVQVKGERNDIQSIVANDIKIRADVGGLKDGVYSVPAKVVLPDNVMLVNSDSLQVRIQKYKTLYLENSKIQIKNRLDGKKYTVITKNVEIILRGMQDELNKTTIETLKPTVNVAGLDVGTHVLPLEITHPSSIRLVRNVNLEVRVENQ